MSVLQKAEKPKDRPIVCTILGDAGIGKTSLAATFPKPVVIRTEDGVHGVPEQYRPDALPVVKSFEELRDQLTALIKEDHSYETVVIDSVTQLEEMFIKHVMDNDDNNPKSINQALGGYGAGLRAVADLHQRIRKSAGMLADRGVNVVFIGHSDTKEIDPPDGNSYTRYDMRLNKKSMSPYTDNVDLIGYLKLRTYMQGEKNENKKAVSDGSRVLVCYPVPSNISKNRYGIEQDLIFKSGENPLKPYVKALQTQTGQAKTNAGQNKKETSNE